MQIILEIVVEVIDQQLEVIYGDMPMTKYKLYRHSPYDKRGNKGYLNNKVKRLIKVRNRKRG